MNKRERRVIAGQVCNYISRDFRAIDGPNAATILHLHSVLESYCGFTLLEKMSATTKGVACLAAKCVFIMEKMKAGYPLGRIPECLLKQKEFINQYHSFRITKLSRYRIEIGPIASAHSVADAIRLLSPSLSQTATMAPCN